MQNKKIIFSAIQPSGSITLGNYLGAVKNWVALQDEYDCIYALADLHAITVQQDPKLLRKNTLEAYALMLACGIDPDKSLLFIQSHVSSHAELSWILSCFAQFGEMSRMTQFKQKSAIHNNNINLGLFSYPCLMAADILLYKADAVPVGADQKQHLELARNIAQRFNSIYGDFFKIPNPVIASNGAKIMSLQDPSKKMSKSDDNSNAYVCVLDTPEVIMKKFKRAVTDSENSIVMQEGKDGINNLISIYSLIEGKSVSQIEEEFGNVGYGKFKIAVAESVIEHLRPIQEKFKIYVKDKAYLEENYIKAAETARYLSSKTLNKVMHKIGFLDK